MTAGRNRIPQPCLRALFAALLVSALGGAVSAAAEVAQPSPAPSSIAVSPSPNPSPAWPPDDNWPWAASSPAPSPSASPAASPAPVSERTQILSVLLGQFRPSQVQTNSQGAIENYGNISFRGELGWAFRPVGAIPLYIESAVNISSFGGTITHSDVHTLVPPDATFSYTLDLFGLDERLMLAFPGFPLKFLVPYVDAGYLFTFYNQHGSEVNALTGEVGNAVAGAGLRIVLNPDATRTGKMSISVMLKADHIFGSSDSIDLESTSFLFGVGFGI